MGILFTILMLVVLFKITGFLLRMVGRLFGSIFGIILFCIFGGFIVKVIGLALIAIPIVIIIGIVSTLGQAMVL